MVRLLAYILLVEGFHLSLSFAGVIDATFTTLYVVFALRGGLRMSDLFFPCMGEGVEPSQRP